MCFGECSRNEARGVVATSYQVSPKAQSPCGAALTCSALSAPALQKGTPGANTSAPGFAVSPWPAASCLNVMLSPQEQGLDDVEKLMRRPKAKAEERLREVLEEFVAGCRFAWP